MRNHGSEAPRGLVLAGGTVRVDVDAAPAAALGIRDGRVAALGSLPDVRAVVGPDAPVVDLAGRTVMPSFTDSHTHFHRSAVLRHLYLDFEALRPESVGDVVRHVAARAAETPAGAWIQGDSLSLAALLEGRLPDRRELDAAAPRHPVLLRGIGKHVVAANSLALAAAGIDRATPDPSGGRIERDADGEPTGILHERAKLRLDTSHRETVVPAPTPEQRLAALRAAIPALHAQGITTIHEMVRIPEEAGDYAELHQANELDLRVRLFYRVHESPLSLDWVTALGLRRGFGDDRLRILGVKVSIDGWCIFGNAAVYEPFGGEHGDLGVMRIEPDELAALVLRADRAGLTVALHAVGPRALDAALDAFEGLGEPCTRPHRVEHAHLDLDLPRLQRMRRLGLIWSAQPGFLPAYRRDWERLLDPARVERIMPLRSGVELGIPLLLNSDAPSGPLGPLPAIRAAVTREADGRRLGAEHAITIRDAWRAHTSTPPELSGDLPLGRLCAGAPADLVVLEGDALRHPEELEGTRVVATMLEGRWVHEVEGGRV